MPWPFAPSPVPANVCVIVSVDHHWKQLTKASSRIDIKSAAFLKLGRRKVIQSSTSVLCFAHSAHSSACPGPKPCCHMLVCSECRTQSIAQVDCQAHHKVGVVLRCGIQ